MSRSTQYIGLTRSAMGYVADYYRVPDSQNQTFGMFDEVVSLGEWVDPSGIKGVRKFHRIKEVVQAEPWSSGPMIFTRLAGFFHNDPECKNPVYILGWVEDPRITGEYDPEKGTFWV